MVKFRQSPRTRNYLSRREQWRLLGLLLALGLVFFLMNEARKAKNWQWFAELGGRGAHVPAAAGPPAEAPADNRLQPKPAPEEIPGVFHSPGPPKAGDAPEEAAAGYFPGVTPAYLEEIHDDTIFRHAEQRAWFHLLGILQQTDEKTLEAESIGRVTFAQLFTQSNHYRGRLVTLFGKVRRAHPLAVPENECGIERYFQVWFQPEDNPTTPMVLYCLELPPGFPTGMAVAEDAAITGFYFKRWAYKAQDAVRTTPVVLARTLDWRRPAEPLAKPVEVNVRFFLIVFGVALAVSVVVMVYLFARTVPERTTAPDEPSNLDEIQP